MKTPKLILSVLFISLGLSGIGQCKSFAKSFARPLMGDYIPNENFNSAKLMPGDEAETVLTFYAGQNYRLLVTNHPILEKVEFKVLDKDRNVIYDNMNHDMSDHFDFNVQSTQQLLVQISVPEKDAATSINPQGCVAIMVGFKEL